MYFFMAISPNILIFAVKFRKVDFEQLMPYAFVLIIAIPFVVLLRQFVYKFIEYKSKELSLLSIKSNNEIRLQAYERMTLFLERIKPSNLVTQFDKDLKPHEFLFLLEKSITEEFEYNASQQLYISKITWNNIVSTKNDVVQLLHKTYNQLSDSANLQDFKTILLMNYLDGDDYISETIQDLRTEVNRLI